MDLVLISRYGHCDLVKWTICYMFYICIIWTLDVQIWIILDTTQLESLFQLINVLNLIQSNTISRIFQVFQVVTRFGGNHFKS
jgi:hypothetical protein